MDIKGTKETRQCIVIPIDNEYGVVQTEYEGRTPDGQPVIRKLQGVQLNLTAFEFRELKYGHSHGLKASYLPHIIERMTEEQLHSMPFVGSLTPWFASKKDSEDLPGDDAW